MGFSQEVLIAAPFFGRNDNKFQIDLIYIRNDKVIIICEIKYHNKEISTDVIPEMERKCRMYPLKRGYTLEKALISLYGPDQSLKRSNYFNYHLTINDII